MEVGGQLHIPAALFPGSGPLSPFEWDSGYKNFLRIVVYIIRTVSHHCTNIYVAYRRGELLNELVSHGSQSLQVFELYVRESSAANHLEHSKCKVKVNLSLCILTEQHAMKAYWGSGRIAPLIL
jgi:hypothetical protein